MTALRAALSASSAIELRFAQMRAQPTFQEIQTPISIHSPLPDFSGMVRAQEFAIARIRLAATDHRFDEAVALLEADNAFARRALAGSLNIVGRRVAATVLARNILLANRLWLVSGSHLLPYKAQLLKLMAPLPHSSVQLGDAFDLELQIVARDMVSNGRDSLAAIGQSEDSMVLAPIFNAVGRHFYLPVATANRMVALAATQRAAYEVPIDAFDKARLSSEAARQGFRQHWWDYVRNPLGSELAIVGVPDFLDYQSGMHNLQALLLLSRARLAIGPQPSADDWSSVLNTLRDPYTGAPLMFDTTLNQPKIRARGSDSFVGQMALMTGGYIVSDPPPLPIVEKKI